MKTTTTETNEIPSEVPGAPTMIRPANPRLLVGHHVTFTPEAVAQVPALGDALRIWEIVSFDGVVGGEPQYVLAPVGRADDLREHREAWLSEIRPVGLSYTDYVTLRAAGFVEVCR